MNQNTAPAGTLAVIGHPANNIRIVKVGERWRYVHSGDLVDPEDFRAGWSEVYDYDSFKAGAERLEAWISPMIDPDWRGLDDGDVRTLYDTHARELVARYERRA